MGEYVAKVLKTEFLNHNVMKIIVEKPKEYTFSPGQATEISINNPELKDEKRPYTILPGEDNTIEFVIKIYEEGFTKNISELKEGDELIITDPWGTIKYKGKGIFIAGGAGVTPFISIFRDLAKKNSLDGNILLFSNKTSQDIFLEEELKNYLKENMVLTFSQEKDTKYYNEKISLDFLKKNISNLDQQFYICGPMQFVVDMKIALDQLGVKPESITIEM